MIKLEEYDCRLLERVSNKLNMDYKPREIDNEFYIKCEELLSAIDELYDRIGYLEEQIEDIKQDIEDNYRPITKAEQYE
jgi:ATP-dependent 26S proteasome regulatory subunit